MPRLAVNATRVSGQHLQCAQDPLENYQRIYQTLLDNAAREVEIRGEKFKNLIDPSARFPAWLRDDEKSLNKVVSHPWDTSHWSYFLRENIGMYANITYFQFNFR
jgi:hypothetical protein